MQLLSKFFVQERPFNNNKFLFLSFSPLIKILTNVLLEGMPARIMKYVTTLLVHTIAFVSMRYRTTAESSLVAVASVHAYQ